MPALEISDERYRQLAAFKPVVEGILGEELEWITYAEMLLHFGFDHMLMGIVGNPDMAIVTVRKLAELEPEIVCQLLRLGWDRATEQERTETRARLEECKKWIL